MFAFGGIKRKQISFQKCLWKPIWNVLNQFERLIFKNYLLKQYQKELEASNIPDVFVRYVDGLIYFII